MSIAIPPATVRSIVVERGITEVLHFTTNPGLTGICASNAVLCRDLLDSDKYLEHIYAPNCASRTKDADWTGFVNLSISRVNKDMLDTSTNWHATEEVWWAVLAFDPAILSDDGVWFTTTNNTYHSCVSRAQGAAGLEALFAPSVEWGYYGSRRRRHTGMADSWTTDPQAEVLYPERLGLDHLAAIYVNDEERIDDVHSITRLWAGTAIVRIECKPEVFQ